MDIMLNWLPPAEESLSSSSKSVLQSYLMRNGIKAKVLYWNILLRDVLHSFYETESVPKVIKCSKNLFILTT